MLNFKVIGCGAAGNKAVIDLVESGYDANQVILINSTPRDVPADYRSKTVIFGKGLGGCGKERSLGKKMLLEDLSNDKIIPDEMVSSRDKGVILVGSTEGGSGSSAIPILAKYFREVVGVNVICVLFFGFQDDTRGLQNSIELSQELSNDYGIIMISNAKFLKEANKNRYKAEQLANKKFIEVVNILRGATIKPGVQVIDDTDLYKIIYTPGYMIADSIKLTNLEVMEDFNSQVLDHVAEHKFINPPKDAGVKREGFIFSVEDSNDAIDYSVGSFTDIFGSPYEKFTNLAIDNGIEGYQMDYILSGMKLPIEELTELYESYIENSSKVNKANDDFFDKVAGMKGYSEDNQFDMMSNRGNKKSKADFFSSMNDRPVSGVVPKAEPANSTDEDY